MGRIKQQAIADEEYFDNMRAWMAVHQPVLSRESFKSIVDDPILLRATVRGWVELGQPYPPKRASDHVAFNYLPTRREVREAQNHYRRAAMSDSYLLWFAFALIGFGLLYLTVAMLGWR